VGNSERSNMIFDRDAGDMLDAARDRIERENKKEINKDEKEEEKKYFANIELSLVEQAIKHAIDTMQSVGYSRQEAMKLIAAYVDVIHDEYREENKQ